MPALDNREIVEKADFLLAQLAPGGLLSPAQADRFIQLAIDESVVLPLMERVTMRSPKELREKIRFGARVLRKGTEATALPEAQRSRPSTSKVELDAKLVQCESRVSFDALKDSIEGNRFTQTIEETLSARISLDLEDLAFNGDVTSVDDLLSTLDGFRVQATTNVTLAGGGTLDRGVLKDAMKTMPSEFRRNRRNLRFMSADEAVIDYHESIGDRATGLGDSAVVDGEVRPFSGIPVIEVPVFPTNLGGGTNETEMLLCDPKNMLFGVWDQIELESERDIRSRVWIIVSSLRIDFKYAHEGAVVKTTGIVAV
jgi:HK97 family phage major capsid protein